MPDKMNFIYNTLLNQYRLVAQIDLDTGGMDIIHQTAGFAMPEEGMDLCSYIDMLFSVVTDEDGDMLRDKLDCEFIKRLIAEGSGERFQFRVRRPETRELFWLDLSLEPIKKCGRRRQALLTVRNVNLHCIERMEEDKRRLEAKAARDPLTGVYNKTAVADLIRNYLDKEGASSHHALLFCDLDNFKMVNDRFGHVFGDSVIQEISEAIVSCFRSSDIIGRVGGDEFIVLIKNIRKRDDIIRAVSKLSSAVRISFPYSGGTMETTVSIGIALYPDDSTDFSTLYNYADWSMYSVKADYPGGYRFFDETDGINDLLAIRNSEDISSRESFGTTQVSIDEYMLNILLGTPNTAVSVNRLLELLGKYFSLSRIYALFVNDANNLELRYLWTAPGVSPAKCDAEMISAVQASVQQASKEGLTLMYCRDTAHLGRELYDLIDACSPGTKSFIQCALLDGDDFKGFVGFDDCTRTRIWTEDESRKLTYLTRLLQSIDPQ